MKIIFFSLLFAISAYGGELSVVFDSRPEAGIPLEAKAQERVEAKSHGTLSGLVGDSVKSVRVRYYSRESWISEKQVREYIAGLLTDRSVEVYTFQIWSQGVGEPEIECLIDFTEDYRSKLITEHQRYQEGRLLLWQTVACFRDGTGKWWFVNLFDYFHRHHPSENLELSRWGEIVGGLQMASSVDESNGVVHCSVRNGETNAVSYNDFDFGYWENVGLEIREGTEWLSLSRIASGIACGGCHAAGKVKRLEPKQVITGGNWTRYELKPDYAVLSGDTFTLDLTAFRFPASFLQGHSLEARVRQTFLPVSSNVQGVTLYSPVLTLNASMIRFFDRESHETK